jgi:hypothetical protein
MDNNSLTPPISSNIQSASSSVEQPSSPLERLDPQRLRDQAVASHLGQHALQGHWSPVPSNLNINSPIRTPQSVQSPLPVSNQQRHSSGSVESLQQFTNQQFFSPNDAGYTQEMSPHQSGRAQIIQSQSPSRIISAQLGSPHAASPSFPVQSSTSNASSSSSAAQSSKAQQQQQQQTQYRMMTINGQTMFATVPSTPGTPTSGPPRVAYQIQQGGQFSYPQSQQPQQQGQPNQQWVAIQPQQMQFAGQPRIPAQTVQRNGANAFPGYPQTPIPGGMIYTANVPGSPHPHRIPIRPQQIVTTQIQQNQIQQGPQTPGTPGTPGNLQTPSTPGPQQLNVVQQQQAGAYYPQQPLTGYPPNYPQNGGQVNFPQQQRHQAPPSVQASAVRQQFVPTNNAHGNPQGPQASQIPPNAYSALPTINGGVQQRPKGVPQQQQQQGIPQQIPPGHFPSHISQTNVNKQGVVDMRSPALMSPNQPVQKLSALPVHSHNMNQMTPRPQQPQQLRMTTQFFYPEAQNNIPPELCFAGCYFLYAENPNSNDLHTLIKIIRYYGGDIDVHNVRSPADKATHVICEYASHVPQFLEQKNKRVCTVAWINDVIEKRRIEPPFKVCHLPSLASRNPAITEKVISITGFSEREAASIKLMTTLIGAKFSPFLSKHTNILIAKSSSSPKVEKALKAFNNTVQIVNLSWICELYMGLTAPITDIGNRRFNVNTNVPLEVGAVTLSKFHESIGRMMVPWQYPLAITEEHLKRARDLRASVLSDESIFASIKYPGLFSGIVPSEDQIRRAIKVLEDFKCKPDIKIAFTGFDLRERDILARKIQSLGVETMDKVERCHILIAPFLVRSTSIFKAVASGKDIVSPLWISTCFNRLKLLDTDDFILRDTNGEKNLGCNLRHTLLESRLHPIFENICFFVTPSVKPSRNELQQII